MSVRRNSGAWTGYNASRAAFQGATNQFTSPVPMIPNNPTGAFSGMAGSSGAAAALDRVGPVRRRIGRAASGSSWFRGGMLNLTKSPALNAIASFNIYALAIGGAKALTEPLWAGTAGYLGRAGAGVGGTGSGALASSVLQATANWAPLGIGEAMQQVYRPHEQAAARTKGVASSIIRGGGEISQSTMMDSYEYALKQEKKVEAFNREIEREKNRRIDAPEVRGEAANAFIAAIGRLTNALTNISSPTDNRAALGRGSGAR